MKPRVQQARFRLGKKQARYPITHRNARSCLLLAGVTWSILFLQLNQPKTTEQKTPTPIAEPCHAVDLTKCPDFSVTCLNDLLWNSRTEATSTVELNGETYELFPNGTKEYEYPFLYQTTRRAVGLPLESYHHRAFVLTQPKVGTGALFSANLAVSDFVVRSHELDMLTVDNPWMPLPNCNTKPEICSVYFASRGRKTNIWVPLPNCRAKPNNGTCTVFFGFRDPRVWLSSAYYFKESDAVCDLANVSVSDEADRFIDHLGNKEWATSIMNWWRFGAQMRALGLSPKRVMKTTIENGGALVIGAQQRLAGPSWMRGCNVVIVQTEKSAVNSKAESTIRDVVPNFRFMETGSYRSRLSKCPGLDKAYERIKTMNLPSNILQQLFSLNEDFEYTWNLFFGNTPNSE